MKAIKSRRRRMYAGKQKRHAVTGRLPLETLEARTLLSVAPNPYANTKPIGPMPASSSASGYVGAWSQEETPTYLPTEHSLLRYGAYLSPPSGDTPLNIATSFLRSHTADLGLTASDLTNIAVTDQYTDNYNPDVPKTTHIYFRQVYQGLEIVNANANVNIDAIGRVISAASNFLHDVGHQVVTAGLPVMSASQAVYRAAANLKLPVIGTPTVQSGPTGVSQATTLFAGGVSLDSIPAALHFIAQADGVHLAWGLVARTPDGAHWYDASIDAASGSLLSAVDWIDHASYNVFSLPAQSPDDAPRTVLTDPADPVASPFGWHDTDGAPGAEFTDTRGNNVDAQEDRDANNTGGFRPDGGPSLNFDFPLDLTQDPSQYQSAAITNLFYVNNTLHDVHYKYGFDEAAGNFQFNDYGKGGIEGDPVQADAQDGEGTDNANFATPPDGQQPRMQMFIFDLTNPNRDGDLDNEIIVHEFGHGVSNRLTGGPANSNALDALQSGGMGEGWSDWWSLMFTQKTTDVEDQAYPVGNYVLGQAPDGPGIRRFPYSFNLTTDPLTIGFFNGGFPNNEVHNTGEIWTSALWDMNWLLVDKYGFNPDLSAGYTGAGSAGNILALQLVMDGLKLQPANPSFKDAHDAILQADLNLTGGANQPEIWTAFARRGMGLSFVDSDANSDTVTPAFDVPSFDLHVTATDPAAGSIVLVKPTNFTVSLSEPYDSATVDASDFSVNGKPANSVTLLDATDLQFHFNTSPVVNQGVQTMAIAEHAIERASDHDGILAFDAQFRYDALLMQVVSTVPADGSVATLPLASLKVNLNEKYDPASVNTSDVSLSMGTVTGFNLVDADTIEYLISGIDHEGTLAFSLAAGALTDAFGNPSLPFAGSVTLDFGTFLFPTPTTSIDPKGGLIYQTSIAGNILPSGDKDSFTILVDKGQTITVIVEPSDTLQPSVTMDHGGGKVTSAGPGLDAVIQSINVPGQLGDNGKPESYKVTVSAANGTTGSYTVRLILNAAAELENYDGATNDTRASAQSLEQSFVQLNPDKAERGAAVGRVRGGVRPGDVYVGNRSFNFFGGSVLRYDSAGNLVQTITNPVLDGGVISDVELGPNNTIYVALSTGFSGSVAEGELAKFDLGGNFLGSVSLPDDSNVGFLYPFGFDVAADGSIWVPQLNSGNLIHVDAAGNLLASYFVSSNAPQDVAVRPDGQVFISQVFSPDILQLDPGSGSISPFAFDPNFNAVMLNFTPSLDLWLGDFFAPTRYDASGNITQTFSNFGTVDTQVDPSSNLWVSNFAFAQIQRFAPDGSFQFSSATPGGSPLGVAVAGIDSADPLPAGDSSDYYSFSLKDGQSATVVVEGLSGPPVKLELQDASGNTLALGASSGPLDQVIDDFIATAKGTYYVKVSGNGSDYSVVVTRNAEFDNGNNDSIATAQDIVAPESGGRRTVMGNVVSGAGTDLFDRHGTPVDGPLVLASDKITLGINADGSYIVGPTGIQFLGNEFVVPGFPLAGFTIGRDGANFTNKGAVGTTDIVVSKEDLSSGAFHGVRIVGIVGGDLRLERIVAFKDGDEYATVATRLTNLGSTTLSNVAWLEDLDPDQGQPFTGDFSTSNDVVLGGQLVHASAFPPAFSEGLTIGLGSSDPRGVVSAEGFDNRDPFAIINSPEDPNGAFADTEINLAFNYGNLSPSQSTFSLMLMTFGSTTAHNDATYQAHGRETTPQDNDFYRVNVDAGKKLEIETSTPADGSGEFVNTLDPVVYLYDSAGHLVASNDNGASDGRNAKLSYKVPKGAGGTYYVQVGAAGTTQGEYILSVKQANAALSAFRVASTDPADGSRVRGPVTAITVDFNDVVLLATLQASDLTIDGVPASGLTVVDGDTAVFAVPSLLAEGIHVLRISAGAIKDVQGTAIQAFTGSFYNDITAPRVVGTSIQENAVLPAGDLTYTVTFSEPMKTSNLDFSDFSLVGLERGLLYFPDSFSYDATGTVLTIHYSGLLDDAYTLTLFSGDGEFEDSVGIDLDGEPPAGKIPPNTSGDGFEGGNFFVDFATDNGTQALPVPLVPVAPQGSLIYQSGTPAVGTIAFAGDTDDYTISLDAGQILGVFADPAPFQRLTIEVRDPSSSVIGSATSAADGVEALLRTLPIAHAGTYTITIGSTGAAGLYSVRVLLNADVESESHGGGPNNDISSAQALDPSFIPLGGGRDRAAVLGTLTPSGLIANGSFETGDFSGWSAIQTGFPFVPWTVSPAGAGSGFFPGTSPQDGQFDAWNGFDGDGPMHYTLDQDVFIPSGVTDVTLSWDDRLQWDFTLTNSATQARTYAVQILDPGTSAVLATLYTFDTGTVIQRGDTDWQTHSFDLGAFAGQTIRLQFDEFIPESFTGPGQYELDAVRLTFAPGESDDYSFALAAGQSATVALTGLSGGGDHVDILDGNGVVLASGVAGSANLGEVIDDFVAPADGSYYIRITGTSDEDYSLVVTRGADFDTESNDSFGTAQNISAPRAVLGSLGAVNPATEERLTFDELPFQSVDGLHFNGVTFGYTEFGVPSPNAFYDAQGPGQTAFINDPSLEGNADGVLTLAFDQPVSSIQFGVAISTGGTVSPGATVELFDAASTLIATIPVTTSDHGFFFSEALFQYSGAEVSRADVSFNSDFAFFFVIDNLKFGRADAEDWYGVDASAGQELSFVTSTPGDGPGEFVNTLNPQIEIYDPSGVLVASGVVLADGRNEQVSYIAQGSGRYRIRVVAEAGTAGEYILAPEGSPAFQASTVVTQAGPVAPLAGNSSTGARSRSLRLDDAAIDQISRADGLGSRLASILGQIDDGFISDLVAGAGRTPWTMRARNGKRPAL